MFVVNPGYSCLDSYVLVTLNIFLVIELTVYFNDLIHYIPLYKQCRLIIRTLKNT